MHVGVGVGVRDLDVLGVPSGCPGGWHKGAFLGCSFDQAAHG